MKKKTEENQILNYQIDKLLLEMRDSFCTGIGYRH
jgi:hypothetical protein